MWDRRRERNLEPLERYERLIEKIVRKPPKVLVPSKDLSVNCRWICELLCMFECHRFLIDHATMLQAYHVPLSIFGWYFESPGVLLGPDKQKGAPFPYNQRNNMIFRLLEKRFLQCTSSHWSFAKYEAEDLEIEKSARVYMMQVMNKKKNPEISINGSLSRLMLLNL